GSNNLATQSTGLPTGVADTTTALLDLGDLANNGGPTQTIALGPGSAAIDEGLDTTIAPYNLATDQRGSRYPRKFGTAVDIGAFEVQNVHTATAITDNSSGSSTYGTAVTFTATVTNSFGNGVTPTGSVEFFDGTQDLGAGSPLSGSGNTATSTFMISTLDH